MRFALLLALAALPSCRTQIQDAGPPESWPLVQPAFEATTLPGEPSLRGLSIPSDDIVWASGSGGAVLRSLDGGMTFERVDPPGAAELDFRSLWAFDAQRAWAMSAGSGELSKLYATRDGGATWTLALENNAPEGFWDSLAFWDPMHGILVGDPVDGYLTVMTTRDGGATWQRVPREAVPESPTMMLLDGADEAPLGEFCFAASNRSIALFEDGLAWIGTGGAKARVWRSTDFGATWLASETPLVSGLPGAGVFGVVFTDARHGVAVGGQYDAPERTDGTAAYTVNGGETWRSATSQPAGYRSSVSTVPLTFATDEFKASERTRENLYVFPAFVAVGTNGISFGRTNQREWQTVAGAPQNLNAVATSPSGGTVIAVGRDGLLVRIVL